ncbi:hypothetical protein HN011_011593 [Eciton burchellii]|nr:hypothetical protein HN011_011593 [Eciton burchellii]
MIDVIKREAEEVPETPSKSESTDVCGGCRDGGARYRSKFREGTLDGEKRRSRGGIGAEESQRRFRSGRGMQGDGSGER